MFGGGIGTYLYTALGGLDMVSNATTTGWQHINAGPAAAAAERLPMGRAQVATRFGTAAVSWTSAAGSSSSLTHHVARDVSFALNATLPAGTTGTLKAVLLAGASKVLSNGTAVWKNGAFVPHAAPGLQSARMAVEEGIATVLFEALSGVYHLEAR